MHARDQVNLNPNVCQCRGQTAMVGGKPGGLKDLCPLAGSRGGASVGVWGLRPQKLRKNQQSSFPYCRQFVQKYVSDNLQRGTKK